MRLTSLIALLGTLAACQAQSQPARPANPPGLTVIELYQSQGCSSCPPALAVLDVEANRADVIALNFAVTYWDQLGWKDRFAKPAFTQRQWDYSHAARRGNVSTPQLIVNGGRAIVGSNEAQVNQAIAQNRLASQPAIAAQGATLAIAAQASLSGTVWIVDYDPRRIPVPIAAGENGGRTLIHRNVVRALTPVGEYRGLVLKAPLPPRVAGLERVVLIQNGKGGPIVAARRI
ncbi:DUF1223 domain-containing protein [Sphingomonas antarctica]|uniref:DUF1223 domain-containing protein n=1 Tax=Sphingomonas antarctica TaxID=2040274 RepID=UPI0039EA1666